MVARGHRTLGIQFSFCMLSKQITEGVLMRICPAVKNVNDIVEYVGIFAENMAEVAKIQSVG